MSTDRGPLISLQNRSHPWLLYIPTESNMNLLTEYIIWRPMDLPTTHRVIWIAKVWIAMSLCTYIALNCPDQAVSLHQHIKRSTLNWNHDTVKRLRASLLYSEKDTSVYMDYWCKCALTFNMMEKNMSRLKSCNGWNKHYTISAHMHRVNWSCMQNPNSGHASVITRSLENWAN